MEPGGKCLGPVNSLVFAHSGHFFFVRFWLINAFRSIVIGGRPTTSDSNWLLCFSGHAPVPLVVAPWADLDPEAVLVDLALDLAIAATNQPARGKYDVFLCFFSSSFPYLLLFVKRCDVTCTTLWSVKKVYEIVCCLLLCWELYIRTMYSDKWMQINDKDFAIER